MNSSEDPWFSELGLDSSIFMDQSDFMDSFDEDLAAAIRQDFENCLSPEHNSSSSPSTFLNNIPSTNSLTSLYSSPGMEPDQNQTALDTFSKFSAIHGGNNQDQSSAPILLNFGNVNHSESHQQMNQRPLNPEEEAVVSEVFRSQLVNYEETIQKAQPIKKKGRIRPPSQTYDHIIAERKRREQLSQLFIALSAIVPGLKKTDKSSVLGDAIKYLKHLQERVESLEEQATKQTMESTVLVRKSQIIDEDEDEGSSSDENNNVSNNEPRPLPEIEARVFNNNILLRIHCEKQKEVLLNLLRKVDSLNLVVVNTNVIPFGNLALDITIIAEMENEFNFTTKEIVTALRIALQSVTK